MQLIQLKIRGLGNVPQTSWVPVKPDMTIFQVNDKPAARHLLQAIQTINPPYDCGKEQPFREYPTEIITASGHRKHIQPFRRTIALAVFNAPPSLVTELGSITSLLFEADRLEVGRKLDYSRWINFVELASSSRWSEISADILSMVDRASFPGTRQKKIRHLVGEMKSTDRINGETMNVLDDWLTDLRTYQRDTDRIDAVIEKIRRAAYFSDARRLVENRMPLFLSYRMDEFRHITGEQHRAGSDKSPRFPPVMLIDLLDESDPDIPRLLDTLHDAVVPQNQCLCFIPGNCSLETRYHRAAVSENEILSARVPAARHAR